MWSVLIVLFFRAYDCSILYVVPFLTNEYTTKAEFIHVVLQDEFGFFYLCCFSTIVDKFMWLEYIARYP